MGMNAATLRLLAAKGLSAIDIAEIAEAMEVVKDPTAAERKRRQRAREAADRDVSRVTSRRDTSPEVSPNDIYSNSLPTPTVDAEASCPPLAEKVVDAWNDGPAKRGATAAKPLDAGRRKALSLRVREHSEAEVFDAIRNLAASDFHCGRNDRGWCVNIGWLLKSPENFQKAIELQPRPPTAAQNPNAPTDLVQHILKRRAA